MPGIAELLQTQGLIGQGILPKKVGYRVLVSDGLHLRSHPVTEVVPYNEGFAMRYKNGSGLLDTVYVGRQYRPLEQNGEYLIGKRLGNNSACGVCVDGVNVQQGCDVIGPSTDPDCPGEDLSSLVRTDGLAIGYRTLYESKIPWKWIIIIGIVAVVIIAIVFIKSRGA